MTRTTSDFYSQFRGNPNRERKNLIASMYVRVLTELCANRFKWKNMPNTVDQRFLELQLFRRALAVFYYDKDYQRFMACSGTPQGKLNMYHNPTEYRVVTPIFSKTVHASPYVLRDLSGMPVLDGSGQPVMHTADAVPIWSNYLRTPDWDIVQVYSSRLAEIDRTFDINLGNMRRPFLIACDQNERQSMVNLYRQVAEGQPVIFGTETMGDIVGSKVQVFDMKMHEQTLLNLSLAKSRVWNECMTLLGINNANQDKKERLVADEVAANDSQVMSARMVALNSRKLACDQINEVWPDMEMDVEWNEEVDQAKTPMMGMMPGMPGMDNDSEGDDE